MGNDNRVLSREDRPSQTECFCVLQPEATRLDCNNNNADISLAPLFFLMSACTMSRQVSRENGGTQIITIYGKCVSVL